MYAKKNSGKKVIALLLILVLLIGCGIGGTIAWLMDFTHEVENTFTVGNINIDLQETVNGKIESTKVNNVGNNNFTIVPGTTQVKDPTVIVEAGSEDCYVFVEIVENNISYNGVTYVEWKIADGWKELTGVEGVYYREYTGGAEAKYPVLEGNQVSYSKDLTKAQIDALQEYINKTYIDNPSEGLPSLTFKAYAVQMTKGESNFTPAEAWDELD